MYHLWLPLCHMAFAVLSFTERGPCPLPASVLVLDHVPLLFFYLFLLCWLVNKKIESLIECLENCFLVTSPMLSVSCLYTELLQFTKMQRTMSVAVLTWRKK